MWEGCKIANLGCLYVYIYACCLSYHPLPPKPEGVKIGPVSATPHSDILICMSQGRRRSDITSSQPVLKTSKQNSFLLSFSYAISDKSKPIKTTKLCLCKLKKIITQFKSNILVKIEWKLIIIFSKTFFLILLINYFNNHYNY